MLVTNVGLFGTSFLVCLFAYVPWTSSGTSASHICAAACALLLGRVGKAPGGACKCSTRARDLSFVQCIGKTAVPTAGCLHLLILIVWHMLLVCLMFQSIIYLEDMPVCRAQCKPPNSLQSTFMSCKAANCFIMRYRIQHAASYTIKQCSVSTYLTNQPCQVVATEKQRFFTINPLT